MSLFARLFAADEPKSPGPHDDFWYKAMTGGMVSSTGLTITAANALEVGAVFACVKVIAETMGILPTVLYRATGEDAKERARDHYLWPILHDQANQWQTDQEFRETITAWAALHGTGHAFKLYDDRTGELLELIPIHPSRVKTEYVGSTRRLRFQITPANGGTPDPYTQDEVFRVNGLSLDAISGAAVSRSAREAIGLARAMDMFASRFFQNDATAGLVLVHPGQLSPEALLNLEGSIARKRGGVQNAFRPWILEEGMTATRLEIKGRDAQLVEARQAQVVEVCRYFRMPPHKIAHLLNATFTNIEHQGLEFVTDTMMPWGTRWEKAAKRDLIVEPDLSVGVLWRALLRGDSAARSTYYRERFNLGTLSRNEIRALEDENPIEGGGRYYLNGATVPVSADGTPELPEKPAGGAATDPRNMPRRKDPEKVSPAAQDDLSPAARDDADRAAGRMSKKSRSAFRLLVLDAAERIASAQTREYSKRADRASEDFPRFAKWAEDTSEELRSYMSRALEPIVSAWDVLGGESSNATGIALGLSTEARAAVTHPSFATKSVAAAFFTARASVVTSRLLAAFNLED